MALFKERYFTCYNSKKRHLGPIWPTVGTYYAAHLNLQQILLWYCSMTFSSSMHVLWMEWKTCTSEDNQQKHRTTAHCLHYYKNVCVAQCLKCWELFSWRQTTDIHYKIPREVEMEVLKCLIKALIWYVDNPIWTIHRSYRAPGLN